MTPHPPKPSFLINGLAGEKKLNGTIKINGAKNAALKAMAAAILFDGPVTLENVPDNADVTTMTEILRRLGATVERKKWHHYHRFHSDRFHGHRFQTGRQHEGIRCPHWPATRTL